MSSLPTLFDQMILILSIHTQVSVHSVYKCLASLIFPNCNLYHRPKKLILIVMTIHPTSPPPSAGWFCRSFPCFPPLHAADSGKQFGKRRIERQGMLLEATGPERALVEGFNRPSLAGGLEKLVRSAAGFTKLDLDLLEEVLCRFLELSGDPHRLESLISSRPARSWVVLKVPGIPRPPIQTHCK